VVNVTTSLVDKADSKRPAALPALTKGGLAAVTRSLAIEYASRGIRVNAVAPGSIQTGPISDDEGRERGKTIPLGHIGQPEEISAAVVFAGLVVAAVLLVPNGIVSFTREAWKRRRISLFDAVRQYRL